MCGSLSGKDHGSFELGVIQPLVLGGQVIHVLDEGSRPRPTLRLGLLEDINIRLSGSNLLLERRRALADHA